MPTQSKIGWRPYVNPSITASSLWNSIYSVYNADAIGSTSLNTSLFAAYNGESNTNDSKGTNNGTAVGGLTYTTGKIGNAFQFNGTTAYVSLPNNSLNSLTTDFSVSGWIYMPANTSSLYCVLLSNVSNDYTTGKGWSVFTYGNNIYFDVYYSGVYQVPNSAYVRLQANNTLTNNAWNHVTITRKNSTSSKIYINGSLVGSNTSIQNPATPTAAITPTIGVLSSVGVGNPLSSYAPNGTKIDEVNVWNKELTASEVIELYNSGNGAQYIGDNFYKPTTNDALLVNNGTAQGGLTYGLGKVGTAFVFNGSNAHVSFPTGAFHSLTTDFSVSAWVSIPAGYSTQIPIFSNISAPSWFSNVGGFWLTLFGYGIQFRIGDKTVGPHDTTTTILTGTITAPPSNTFVHIVATRKAGQRSRIYYNGTLIANNTDARNPAYYTSGVNTTTPTIGNIKIPNGVQDSYYAPNGTKIDGLSVWSKELTQSEITELYNSGNGKQYVSSLDSDAQAFIASAAITVTTQQTAINTLVTDLKAANIWTKMKAIYPFVGGTATQHRFNLKDPRAVDAAYYLTFYGGGTHSSTGYLPNGTTAYADTKFTPLTSWSTSNAHSSYYSRTNISLTSNQILFDSFIDSDSNYQLFLASNGLMYHSSFNSNNGSVISVISSWGSRTDGFFIGNRANINSNKIYRNSTLVGNNTDAGGGTLPNIPLFLAAANTSGGAVVFSKLENSFASLGDGLTDAEALAFYTAVQK